MKILIDISSKLDEQRIAQEEVDEVRSMNRCHHGAAIRVLLLRERWRQVEAIRVPRRARQAGVLDTSSRR